MEKGRNGGSRALLAGSSLDVDLVCPHSCQLARYPVEQVMLKRNVATTEEAGNVDTGEDVPSVSAGDGRGGERVSVEERGLPEGAASAVDPQPDLDGPQSHSADPQSHAADQQARTDSIAPHSPQPKVLITWELSGVDANGVSIAVPVTAEVSPETHLQLIELQRLKRPLGIMCCRHVAGVYDRGGSGDRAVVIADSSKLWGKAVVALNDLLEAPHPSQPEQILRLAGLATTLRQRLECFHIELGLAWVLANPPLTQDDPHYGPEDFPASAGGEGAPKFRGGSDIAFAVASKMPAHQGARFLMDAGELITRMPQTWAEVKAAEVPVFRARRAATKSMDLTACAVKDLDREIAPHIADITPRQLNQAIAAIEDLHMPNEVASRADSQARDVGVYLDRRNERSGLTTIMAKTEIPHAVAFVDLVRNIAQELKASGRVDSIRQGEAEAIGLIGMGLVDIKSLSTVVGPEGSSAPTGDAVSVDPGKINLYVHMAQDQLMRRQPGSVAIETFQEPVTADQVARWAKIDHLKIRVTPVVDLGQPKSSNGYTPSGSLREQVLLNSDTCAFPGCNRTAKRADLDHIKAYAEGGETSSLNLAPLCRKHHRAKTRREWEYEQVGDEYIWKSLTTYLDSKYLRKRKVRPLWFKTFSQQLVDSDPTKHDGCEQVPELTDEEINNKLRELRHALNAHRAAGKTERESDVVKPDEIGDPGGAVGELSEPHGGRSGSGERHEAGDKHAAGESPPPDDAPMATSETSEPDPWLHPAGVDPYDPEPPF